MNAITNPMITPRYPNAKGAHAESLLLPDVMERYPNLTYFGFGPLNRLGALWTPEQFQDQRDNLAAATRRIHDARGWIKEFCAKRRTINKSVTSYDIKHQIEKYLNTDINHGACIAAFIMEGYRVHHTFDWGPNCAFNVSFPPRRRLYHQARETGLYLRRRRASANESPNNTEK
jgi:hypothetical protein